MVCGGVLCGVCVVCGSVRVCYVFWYMCVVVCGGNSGDSVLWLIVVVVVYSSGSMWKKW